jgi:hypothetical protein
VQDDRDALDHLLARGGLGGPQRDAILERVLARTAAAQPRRSRWRNLLMTALTLGTVSAGALLLIRVPDHGFRARGDGLASSIGLDCVGGTLAACPQGATLLFALSGQASGGYLEAYATGPDGDRIWYFSAEVEAPFAAASAATRALTRGIRVGQEHHPGRHEVRVFVTRRPLSRAELLAPPSEAVIAAQSFTLTVAGR